MKRFSNALFALGLILAAALALSSSALAGDPLELSCNDQGSSEGCSFEVECEPDGIFGEVMVTFSDGSYILEYSFLSPSELLICAGIAEVSIDLAPEFELECEGDDDDDDDDDEGEDEELEIEIEVECGDDD